MNPETDYSELVLSIRRLEPGEIPPYHLLMLADPSREMIDKNIQSGLVYLAFIKDQLVGTFILQKNNPEVFEIMNIAVKEAFRGQGFGKQLLEAAETEVKLLGGNIIELGTGNSSIQQLAFYQKAGFRITGIRQNYFLDNYEDPIEENGIRCLDMIRLSKPVS